MMGTAGTGSDQVELELLRSTARKLFENRDPGPISLRALADIGVMGLLVPEEVGGAAHRVRSRRPGGG